MTITPSRRLSIAVAVALFALLTTSVAAGAATRFGAKLANDVQPQPALGCNYPDDPPDPRCTWVMAEAFGRPDGGHKAPRDGTIDKVRVSSCTPGSFRVQIAKLRPALQQAKVKRNGPTVDYNGDPDCCDDEIYKVSVVNVPNFHINRGEVIAIRARRTGALRCGGGGDHTLFFEPPLVPGGGFRPSTGTPGNCLLLVEFQYTN